LLGGEIEMADYRKNIECSYCGAKCHIKYTEELIPNFCCFCGEDLSLTEVDEEDDGDLDYTDDEREEVSDFN